MERLNLVLSRSLRLEDPFMCNFCGSRDNNYWRSILNSPALGSGRPKISGREPYLGGKHRIFLENSSTQETLDWCRANLRINDELDWVVITQYPGASIT